jgi:hypothetical protein
MEFWLNQNLNLKQKGRGNCSCHGVQHNQEIFDIKEIFKFTIKWALG